MRIRTISRISERDIAVPLLWVGGAYIVGVA
jgi:hypothetical protein